MWSGFQTKKLNTRRELQLELDANGAELENQAGFVPGPDPDLKKNFEIFFQKIKSATMPVQHVKGQTAASTYVWEKWGVKILMDLRTPCIST